MAMFHKGEIENPLAKRTFVDDQDMKDFVDEYFRRNPDPEVMTELQSILDAHKAEFGISA
jgi:hypothetical protein